MKKHRAKIESSLSLTRKEDAYIRGTNNIEDSLDREFTSRIGSSPQSKQKDISKDADRSTKGSKQ